MSAYILSFISLSIFNVITNISVGIMETAIPNMIGIIVGFVGVSAL